MNNNPVVFDGETFDIKNIQYSAPKSNKAGKFIFTKQDIFVKCRNVYSFGASEYKGNDRFKLSIQFNEDSFKQNMMQFEEELKNDVFRNAKQWLGKDIKTIDAVDAFVSPIVKTSTKVDKESQFFHIKLVKDTANGGEWKFELYNLDRTPIYPPSPHEDENINPIDVINSNSDVDIMFHFNGFSIVNGKAHPSLTLYQMKLNTQFQKKKERKCEL